MRNGDLGFWQAVQTPPGPAPAPGLEADLEVDTVIVGGGYTGLWTALALAERDPSHRIAILEAEHFGFGASGRNGGWLSAKPVGKRRVLADRFGRDRVVATERLLLEAMRAIPSILEAAGHPIDAHPGGWLQIARTRAELERCEAAVADARSWGLDASRVRILDAKAVRARIGVAGAVGGISSPDNVRIDPMALINGLCALADAANIQRYGDSRVVSISKRAVATARGHRVHARHVVVATEGYSSALPSRSRQLLPLNSAMIATRQLTTDEWEQVGWQGREGIAGSAHTYFYGQRTPDDRIILGGRGKPYRFGSAFDDRGRVDAATVRSLEALTTELFGIHDLRAEFAWCGVLGVARDWTPFIDADPDASIVDVGGYAGQGVTASKVAGEAVAAIIGGDPTGGGLPWVRPRPRRWEPEPLRWIGANGLYRAYSLADAIEARTGRTSVVAKAADLFAGR
jgi:glycine/D-amino acid oxidase-like deaminating enzyme